MMKTISMYLMFVTKGVRTLAVAVLACLGL